MWGKRQEVRGKKQDPGSRLSAGNLLLMADSRILSLSVLDEAGKVR
jgi:hypothetical protein